MLTRVQVEDIRHLTILANPVWFFEQVVIFKIIGLCTYITTLSLTGMGATTMRLVWIKNILLSSQTSCRLCSPSKIELERYTWFTIFLGGTEDFYTRHTSHPIFGVFRLTTYNNTLRDYS
ncbi:hypothetical protein BT69DRAFT_491263 [Atractiella rhizophila]|nr:hypothetical protein BT69DRAFT_491263 [Atractiella rhizophila]